MKQYLIAVFVVWMSLMMTACDLVVTTLETTEPARVNSEDMIEVPIRVIVKNQGQYAANTFKVATEYTDARGTFVVPFTVAGESSIWYPYTHAPLDPGAEVTFTGVITFLPSLRGETVALKAIADSCSGDEFMPDYCRVQETDESNNESTPLSLSLP